MVWPSSRDFSNAVMNASFDDRQLAKGKVELNPRTRMPLVWPGSFASVYKIAAGQNFAVRCFTRDVPGRQTRYSRLAQYLRNANPPGFVEFKYQPRGIRIYGEWYPILKMEWIDGHTLEKFVENNLYNPNTLKRISGKWQAITFALQSLPVAHNDLQHGNIIVQPDESIRLVDYDGIFLPRFQGNDSPEVGHSNYQHPKRTSHDYDAHIDNFPALVIHLSLLAVAADPGLWHRYHKDKSLIFTQNDFAQPRSSELFRTLKSNGDAAIRNLASVLEDCCARPVSETPMLESILKPQAAPAPAPAAPTQYRDLLRARQPSSPPPAATQISVIPCPQCYQSNPSELVYCDAEKCYAILYPGNRNCAHCGISGPVNASYCHDCGKKVA